jgi:Transport and Golgi organisation 2
VCTVTWAWSRAGGPERASYELGFNRDERLTRGPEQAPTAFTRDGTRVLAPADGDHGGTWLAVNEHGLTTALLNGYVQHRGPARDTWTSRGLLVRGLCDALDAETVVRRLEGTDLEPYQPFSILALGPGASATLASWDGLELTVDREADERRPLASSGHDQPRAQRWRRARYAELLSEEQGSHAAVLERFLGDHGQGANALTPCMHRSDAATRSQCRVRVDGERVELVYTPGAPCRNAPSPPQVLARRPPLPRRPAPASA